MDRAEWVPRRHGPAASSGVGFHCQAALARQVAFHAAVIVPEPSAVQALSNDLPSRGISVLSAPAALHPKRHGVGSGQAPELLTVGPQAALAELPREALGATGEDAFRKPFSTAPAIPRVPRRCRFARARREAKLQRRVFIHPPVSLSAVCFSLASGGVALAAAGFTRAALVSAPRGEQAVATRANPALAVGAIEQFAVLTTGRARPARRGHHGTVPRLSGVPRLVAAGQKPAQGPTQRQPGLGPRRTRGRAVRTDRRRRSQHRRRSALRATAIAPRS